MSEKAEQFARQLLTNTENGNLKWKIVPDPEAEIYRYDAAEGLSFSILRKSFGDDKFLTFELKEHGRSVLTDSESNVPMSSEFREVLEKGRAIVGRLDPSLLSTPVDAFKIKRFRLYSDLFYAARDTAEGRDQAIEKAEQFFKRLA